MENNKLKRLCNMLRQVGAKPDDFASQEPLEGMTGLSKGVTRYRGLETPISVNQEMVVESLDWVQQGRDDQITEERQYDLEAIVLPAYRPVIDIVDNQMKTEQLGLTWKHLGEDGLRRVIESTFKSVGCIELPGHPTLPYAGTGFIVDKRSDGRGIIMTNRHVADVFSSGVGVQDLHFHRGQKVQIDFLREYGRDAFADELIIEKVLMMNPCCDMALLQVAGLCDDHDALQLCTRDPADLQGREVVTVGYPGYDPRGDADYQNLQNDIFRSTYFVKRLQPGHLQDRENIESYNRIVSALTHDCSTLGGNSGSAVLLLPQHPDEYMEVVCLHFAGAYMRANYAVPCYDLATDRRVVDTGIQFSGDLPPTNSDYDKCWQNADPEAPFVSLPAQTSFASPSAQTLKIPLEISINVGSDEVSYSIANGDNVSEETEEGLFSSSRPIPLSDLAAMFSLTSLSTNTFDWDTALSLAVSSQLAYEHQGRVEDIARNSWGLNRCTFIDEKNTQCFIASSGRNALIAFRGTQEVADWLNNINVLNTAKAYGNVHTGFYRGFRAVKIALERTLNSLSPRRVFLTGHSLGGALATIAAAEWQGSYPITGVYTFGQPAVSRGAFSRFFSNHYNDTFFRFVNENDIVARVPHGYHHAGTLLHFNARGRLTHQTENLSGDDNGSAPPMLSEAEFEAIRA
ncbi:MAG: trypsin-like peptidase domain-containing protein, partial [Chloroflexota bacterium]